MNNLAGVLERLGKYEEAEGTHRRTLALKESVLGKKHPSTLGSMNNLAGVLERQLTVPKADGTKVGSYPQYEVLQTPVTPVSTEALTSLHNMIKQDAHALNETSIQRLQRHVQKLANAAQISFAERALLQDQNQFLTRMNNEAKVRRSTKSVVLGKAKVMSYEDLVAKRAEKEAKEQAKTKGNGKRGRKRKSAAPEADAPEPKAKVSRMSEAQVEEDEIAPEPPRAPVARMW